jgi:hypothetical protein
MRLGAVAITIPVLLLLAWPASAQQAPAAEKIGQVSFPISCNPAAQKPFERAVALLHSFWYLEAVKGFTAVTQIDPQCAIGYWGVAMSNWTQIWSPPPPPALKRGWEAVEKAKAATTKGAREADFIDAAEAFFKDADKLDHRTRAMTYSRVMEQAYGKYPNDREVAIFYALSLQATADPKDKTYARQKKSAEIAEKVFAAEPDHPGAAHYIIHAYDYPALAQRGVPAASRYAQFAPAVPHALHMPAHIYVLLGMWPETIQGNIGAAEAERTRGNPDDEMHAIDYLVYGYLQQAQDADAKRIVDRARGIMSELAAKNYNSGRPTAHFAMAAIEARWAMERGRWAEAAAIDPRANRFPHTEAMIYFARAVGAARTSSAWPICARRCCRRRTATGPSRSRSSGEAPRPGSPGPRAGTTTRSRSCGPPRSWRTRRRSTTSHRAPSPPRASCSATCSSSWASPPRPRASTRRRSIALRTASRRCTGWLGPRSWPAIATGRGRSTRSS